MKHIFLSALLAFLTSCVSLAPRSETPGAQASGIDGVTVGRWANNACAAGALSEVLNALGDPVTEEKLVEVLPRARSGGVVSPDLLLAARGRGFDAQLIKGEVPLVMEQLAQGQPLILMIRVLDAPGVSDDLFHYVVLSGLDRERQLVRLHYGDGVRRWVAPAKFESSWAAAGYATVVVRPKSRRAAHENDLRRAVLLEEEGKTKEAMLIYRHFVNSHPLLPHGWTNLGNAQTRLGDASAAEASYRNALLLDPDHFESLNNLAWLLYTQKRYAEAEPLARRAAAQDNPDRELALDTLAHILAADAPPAKPQTQSDATPAKRSPVRRTLAVLTAATIYDVEATFYRLNRCDECVEANPLLRPFIDRGRLATYAFSAAVNAAMMYFAKRSYERGNAWWDLFPLTVSVVHAGAGTWNLVRAGRDE